MKNKFLLLILFFSVCTYSQTMTEKYNSILGRYEFFDNQGNLTGYKVYDSLFKEWKYYKVDVEVYESKPIQYNPPPKDNNFKILAETAMRMDRNYRNNPRSRNYSYNQASRNYSNEELGLGQPIKYKYSFGGAISFDNIYNVNAGIRLGKFFALEIPFEKYFNKSGLESKQFAVSLIPNAYISLFSKKLFLLMGIGASYSKDYDWDNTVRHYTLQNNISAPLQFGCEYDFEKIPIALNFYYRLPIGNSSFYSSGFGIKYIVYE